MADVYPPSTYYNKRNMRRTAPSGASSRIPLPADVGKIERFPSAPQPSRLQKLQANFQYKVMKEKEAKMIDMYERQQYQALQRIAPKQHTDKGMVREFFRERRMIEQGGVQSEIPTRDEHFNRMKSEVQQQREAIMRQDLSKVRSREDLSRRPPAGLDRAKPLAPLKKRATVHNMNTSQHKLTENDVEQFSNTTQVLLAKKKLKKINSLNKFPKRYSQQSTDESSDDEPTTRKPTASKNRQPQSREPETNQQRWEQNPFEKKTVFVGNKKKVVSEIKDRPDFANKTSYKRKDIAPARKREEKMSDFQKWQMEQDLDREQRLNKLRKQTEQCDNTFSYDEQSDDSNWKRNEPTRNEVKKKSKKGGSKNSHAEDNGRQRQFDVIKQKEKELQEIIAKQEAELKMIKESYISDDCATPRQLNDSMNQMKLQSRKSFKKPMEKPESLQRPTPPKANKPDKSRRPSIKDNATKFHLKQPQEYEEDDQIGKSTNDYDNYDNNDYSYDIEGAMDDSDQVDDLNLKACSGCGRKFAADRLAKHAAICRKSSNKKRKIFDMTKHRTAGTELAQYVRNDRHLNTEPTHKKSNWKRKHEDFVRTVRDARVVQAHVAKGGKISDLPPPPPSDNSDYKPCPYCKRRFNPATAERHIPKCKDIKSRPKPPSKRR